MKKLFTLLTMLIVAIGTSWAIDVTDTFSSVVYRNTDNDKTKAMGANVGISSLTLSGDATISSSSFQVASNATGGFTVTTPTGFAIKTITFKEKSSNKVSSLTCSDGGTSKITGPTSKVYTYTATTTINSVTFTWSGNGGNAQINEIVVTMTNDDIISGLYEKISPTGNVSSGAIPFSSSLGDDKVVTSLTQFNGASSSSSSISFGNGKGFTLTTDKAIKEVYFTWIQRSPTQDSDWGGYTPSSTTAVGAAIGTHSYTANKWTAPDENTKSVTFKRNVGNSAQVASIHVIYYPAGPSITTQPQSASYVTGDEIAALTVEATASKGDLAYQWYSCDDADKTNAEEIDGAESASYTPTAAGFYYVNVKDDNGNIDSDVAQITISAAEAPTINVSGAPAEVVKVGTEVTLTATATGVPTPTIKWYKKNTLGEVETGATFTVPTDEAGEFTYYAVATNSEGSATSDDQVITVKEQVATPTFTPNGAYFEESQSVVIESATEDAVIEYSTDGGESWTAYTEALNITETTTIIAKATKQDYLNSETATATFTKVTLDPQVDVTAAASWDWSKFGTSTIQLTDATTPSKTTEFVLSNIVNYGKCSAISADFGDAQQLKVTTEYVVREYDGKGKGYLQGGHIKFNTTVPGTVTVTYSNTGNRSAEGDRRFLNVNGSNYGEGTMSSGAKDKTTSVDVAAGEVHIKGTLKSNGSDQYLRIYSIEFTPATSKTITIDGEAGVTTFVAPYDLDFTNVTELSAYAVTVINSTSVTTEKVGKVPAGTALLIKGETAEVPVAESADPITNLLLASTGAGVQGGDNIYAYSKTKKKFCKVASTVTIPVGKAYLDIEANTDALDIDFDGEATGVNGVAEAKAEVAPVKVIKNGKLYIGNYNVAGQLVK